MRIRIDTPADPRLTPYIGLRDAHTREQGLTVADATSDSFIAEGELVIRQLVESGLAIRSILGTPARLDAMQEALNRVPGSVPVFAADQAILNAVAGFNIHRGILAHGVRPAPRPLEEVLVGRRAIVVLEDLSNHDNVGGVFRATAALGGLDGAAVLLSPRCADPFYRKAVRVSMGTVLRLPHGRIDPWPQALAGLKAAGFTTIALTPAPDAVPLREAPPAGRVALLLGAEGPGLTAAAMAAADLRVRIPIDPRVDSLNVVTAAAIVLHHFCGSVTG